jgi:hypothetical protein
MKGGSTDARILQQPSTHAALPTTGPAVTHQQKSPVTVVDALLAAWQALARAERALDHPFRRPASLTIDQAIVALAELEEHLR